MYKYKQLILVVCFAVFPIVNLGFAKKEHKSRKPKIVCEAPVFDFGTLESGVVINHSFVISNAGNASLEMNIKKECCGTTANIKDKIISPGDSSALVITYLVRGHNRDIIKDFPVVTNDPDQPDFKVRLTGKSIAFVRTEPQAIMFGSVKPDVVTTTCFSILCYSNIAIRITNVTVTPKHLALTYLKNVKTNAHVIKIHTVPDLPLGILRGFVTVFTDHPQYPIIIEHFTMMVAQDIVVVPKKVVLTSFVKKPEPVSCYVLIRSRTNKRFSITKVEAPQPGIKTEWKPTGNGVYQITFSNIIPEETLDGKNFIITIINDDVEKINIPIQVKFRETDLNAIK